MIRQFLFLIFFFALNLCNYLCKNAVIEVKAGPSVYDSYPIEFGTEYDSTVIDPLGAYGAPYGGYGRASRETLAKLPLILPEILVDHDDDVTYDADDIDDDDELYFRVRDQGGQLFSCRLYNEDALDAMSLQDSMFDAPLFRTTDHKEKTPPKSTVNVAAAVKSVEPIKATNAAGMLPSTTRVIRSKATSLDSTGSMPSPATAHGAAEESNNEIDPIDVETSLQELRGVCGQVHKGFWSYEWCFEKEVTQFHVEYDTSTNQVKVEQVTSLGNFKQRDMYLNIPELDVNEWTEEEPEVARIIDAHTGGTLCDGTPRRTYAHIQCCSDKVIQRHKGMIHRDGRPFKSDIVGVLDVIEDPDVKCMYNFTICTPLLCGSDAATAAVVPDEDPVEAIRLLQDLNEMDTINEDENIRQILDRTLSKLCLQTQSGVWWIYEICHKKTIRQFHETVGIRTNSAGAKVSSKVIESEHILGKYDPSSESHVHDDEEWNHVVNATTAATSWGEGNGAYYEVEYIGGDTCDTSDVTDSAIVAGTAGKTVLRRSASVRYHCGQIFDVQVREDATCHYIVDVKVPGLCRHPLFRAPISKKQVMKCLPVDDDM